MVLDLSSAEGYGGALDQMKQHLGRGSIVPLKRLSNEIVEYAATKNDTPLLYLAIISYILYKILAQSHIVGSRTWSKDKEKILDFLDVLQNNRKDLQFAVNKFVFLLRDTNPDAFRYIRNIEKKGRIKVGARLYSMGFSQVKIKELLNLSGFELQQYLAESAEHTKIPEDLLKKKTDFLKSEFDRDLIFDSSALISLGSNGLWDLLVDFKKKNPEIHLYITKGVYEETVKIKERVIKFGWLAVQLEYLINNNILELIPDDLTSDAEKLAKAANSVFYTKHGKLEILQKGELESVVFAKKKNSVLVIDEIVTRWLVDEPTRLHALMEKRYKDKVLIDANKFSEVKNSLSGIPVVRSVDLTAFAIKEGYFARFKDISFSRFLLYAIKSSGCATTYEEIDAFVKDELKEVFTYAKKEAFN